MYSKGHDENVALNSHIMQNESKNNIFTESINMGMMILLRIMGFQWLRESRTVISTMVMVMIAIKVPTPVQ